MNLLLLAILLASPGPQGSRPDSPGRAERSKEPKIVEIAYADDENPRHKLLLFLPTRPAHSDPLPLVIWIHGGGWRQGDFRSGDALIRPLMQSGRYAAASIGYRLTDEAQWPAQVHDCKAALRWLRANASKYNINPDRVAVVGPSAGGHLSAMLGTSAGVPAMQGELGAHDQVDDRVTCVVDLFGPTDLLKMDTQAPTGATLKHDAPHSPESKLLGAPLQSVPKRAASANPITYVTSDDPPFLIIHGTADRVVPYGQSVLLDTALDQAEVNSILITLKGAGHGGRGLDQVDGQIRAFLEKHLHGADVMIEETTVVVTPNKSAKPGKGIRPSNR